MKNNNILLYLNELKVIQEMFEKSIIDEDDFKKAEAYLAKKHCIKDKSIYRLNELIIEPTYGINIDEEKEVKDDSNNEDRSNKKVIEIIEGGSLCKGEQK